MSNRRYPSFGGVENYKKPSGRCSCCNALATHKVTVQFDWFRGNDEVYPVCTEHKPGFADLNRFLRLVEDKYEREAEEIFRKKLVSE